MRGQRPVVARRRAPPPQIFALGNPDILSTRKRAGEAWMLVSVEGLENSLRVASIDCTPPLAEIYDRVEFPPEEGETPADEG